jgi:N-formylglutamate amidohydrolase
MGGILRPPPDSATRQSLLDRWYWPHHSKLERMVDDVVRRLARCLIVDCHSFPSVALPYELDQREGRADFCIGTDTFHTPAVIRDAIVSAVKEIGYSVAIDAPFAALPCEGTYRGRIARPEPPVLAVEERGGMRACAPALFPGWVISPRT